jgi:hypothetical protein
MFHRIRHVDDRDVVGCVVDSVAGDVYDDVSVCVSDGDVCVYVWMCLCVCGYVTDSANDTVVQYGDECRSVWCRGCVTLSLYCTVL